MFMKVSRPLIGLAAMLLLSTSAHSQAAPENDPCSSAANALKKATEEAAANFKKQIDEKKEEYGAQAEEIKKDAPSADGVEAAVGFDVETSWRDERVILHLPEVAMREQTWIMHLPEVTVNQQKWIWDRPSVRMVRAKCGQYPEFVCRNVRNDLGIELPECYTQWSDIICDVPEPFSERVETILGVPEFAMRENRIILHVPEFAMREQQMILRLPSITIKNIRVEAAKTKEKADELKSRAEAESQSLSSAFKAETEKASGAAMADLFQCKRNELVQKKFSALAALDAQITGMQATVSKAGEVGANEIAASTQEALVAMLKARTDAAGEFDRALADLDSQAREKLGTFANRYFEFVEPAP